MWIDRFRRRANLGALFLALFLVAWGLQTWSGWLEFKSTQQMHGEPANILGPNGYVWLWGRSTLENWQAVFLHLLAVVALTTSLVQPGGRRAEAVPEPVRGAAKELDELQRRLDGIERQLGQLSQLLRARELRDVRRRPVRSGPVTGPFENGQARIE
ncbi:MAG TPA: DUF6766 family protein [Chloroflexota bacterium]|nr:DUF6766 family protein [Chloroflexota bacterium]